MHCLFSVHINIKPGNVPKSGWDKMSIFCVAVNLLEPDGKISCETMTQITISELVNE